MTDAMAARYARAERSCEWNVRPRVRNVAPTPRWTGEGDRFRYHRELPDGTTEVVLVDPEQGTATVSTDARPSSPTAPPDRLRSPDARLDLLAVEGDLWV